MLKLLSCTLCMYESVLSCLELVYTIWLMHYKRSKAYYFKRYFVFLYDFAIATGWNID